MGVIVRETYVCDFCGKAIEMDGALVGNLSLRKQGARGLGRNVRVALHGDCSEMLTRYANPVPQGRRQAAAAS